MAGAPERLIVDSPWVNALLGVGTVTDAGKASQPPPLSGRPPTWRAADDLELRRLLLEGLSVDDICLRMGRTKCAIKSRRWRLGLGPGGAAQAQLPRPEPGRPADRWTPGPIAIEAVTGSSLWDGPMYGVHGALAIVGSWVQCHICGRWYVALSTHIKAHRLSGGEYKALFGLNRTSGLVGPALQESMRKEGYRLLRQAKEMGINAPSLLEGVPRGGYTRRLETVASPAHRRRMERMKTARAWPADRRRRFQELAEAGWTDDALSREFRVALGTAREHRLGIGVRRREAKLTATQVTDVLAMSAAGRTNSEVAAYIGISSATVGKYRRQAGLSRRWSLESTNELRELQRAGMPDKVIASRLGKSLRAVRSKWWRLSRQGT